MAVYPVRSPSSLKATVLLLLIATGTLGDSVSTSLLLGGSSVPLLLLLLPIGVTESVALIWNCMDASPR
jgi:hypothetical protein